MYRFHYPIEREVSLEFKPCISEMGGEERRIKLDMLALSIVPDSLRRALFWSQGPLPLWHMRKSFTSRGVVGDFLLIHTAVELPSPCPCFSMFEGGKYDFIFI